MSLSLGYSERDTGTVWGDEPKDEHGTYTNKTTGTIDCEITVLRFQSFGAQNQVDTLPEISQHLIVSTRKKNAKR